MEEQPCGSYSSQRRRVRQAVTDSWLQILSVQTNTELLPCIEGKSHECTPLMDLQFLEGVSQDEQLCQDASELSRYSDSNSYTADAKIDVYDDSSCSSDSDVAVECEDGIITESSMGEKLAEWAVKHNITHRALGDLLALLQSYHPGLPKDPRTLMATPRNYSIRHMENNDGQYYHFGIVNGIKSLNHLKYVSFLPEILLQLNFDGLPLFKSSACELWPVLCLIKNLQFEPFVVGLYCGKKKPSSLNDYLKEFVEELQFVLKSGLEFENCHYTVKLQCFVGDAPARAFIKNVKGHSGYFGCDKCIQEGHYIDNRMTFPNSNAPLRTDEQFRTAEDYDEHHRGPTPLNVLEFRLVSGFALDYMHLVCLGVMRKLLLFWLNGRIRRETYLASRLSSVSVQCLSAKLVDLRHCLPREFVRRPRSLSELDRWKATEFRSFLLYTGPVVLKGVLSDTVYSHFMLSSSAISLLASPNFALNLMTMHVNCLLLLLSKQSICMDLHL
jgi:hypothetical protein